MNTVTLVTAVPGTDVLSVQGVDGDGVDLQATGWQSAMTNYYPPEMYDADGNFVPGAVPRAMTGTEQLAYCQSLLDALAPVTPAPVVLYQAPTPT